MASLYIHIPFCKGICSYCDFAKLIYNQRWAFSYIEALKDEIDYYEIKEKMDTVYIGGGTPSALDNSLLEDLLSYVSPMLKEGGEFTMEMNPEDANKEKLEILSRYGVNRLSFGVESSNEDLLKIMERRHSFEDAKSAISMAKEAGFSNISADFIYGLPGEDMKMLEKDIEDALSLNIPHLSFYSLIIEEATKLSLKGYKEAEDDINADFYECILFKLREAGYRRYEVSNFSKPGYESRHNLVYWHDDNYYGVGLGASGYLGNIRYKNTRSLTKYLNHEYIGEKEELDQKSELEDFFLTNLRLEEGFSLKRFEDRFSFSFLDRYGKEFDKLQRDGFLKEENDYIKPTDKGIILLDKVLLDLF